ncbi:Zinc finger C2H2 type domain signature [Nakaseomyces glabratus]|nr:Zinc finger C2H2 type domain signature [Nakaseomyces glabratus]KAH7590486.1 Zinc finger C2H2 type domain signature [Nakaseomyces glabratus]KAI8396196.1 Zinc finger C2H2 type domain signature [Nakaseomyces glabratus]OXB42596.1 hypothetical protein B1J91_I09350g [Nakaseomyces glabratus]OXB47895.1 hypothetical protein B1J92_I09350g [Nakaseomyces glabratus]
MSMYTCNSCELVFETSAFQRQHMKTDWHRYNLKRKVASLPPVSEDNFNSKVQVSQEQAAEEALKKGKNEQLTKKEIRRREKEALLEKKKKLLEIARQNMLAKMQEQGLSQPEPTKQEPVEDVKPEPIVEEAKSEVVKEEEVKEEDLTEEELAERLMKQKLENRVEIPLNQCLFCTKKREFENFEANLDHMFRTHGFYIPEQKYLVDKEGLVKYMSEKIGLGNVCIVCNYQGRSLDAVRAHMLDKRHCRIPYESEDERLEISEFYDFSKTYERIDRANIVSADSVSANDDEWEDVDENEDAEEEEGEPPKEYLYHDGVELHLPSGVKVGHRSLQRYFKQDLRPEKELSEGQGTLVAAETRSFLPQFDRGTVRVQQRAWKTEVRDKKRDDKRAAKFVNNQPHYRDQLLQ